jgi:7-carboxy-7-deazaguanine synthase
MYTLELCEAFTSLQGETSYAGLPCFFIRLSGCNLACTYCDTRCAREPGNEEKIETLVQMAGTGVHSIVVITGGEPLLQPSWRNLALEICARQGLPVLVETNGSKDISNVPAEVTAVVDFKCPGSGMSDEMDWGNIDRLRKHDEVKFVIGDRRDYQWACGIIRRENLGSRCSSVYLMPVWGRIEPGRIARWMLEDGVKARLGIQLHKIAGVR